MSVPAEEHRAFPVFIRGRKLTSIWNRGVIARGGGAFAAFFEGGFAEGIFISPLSCAASQGPSHVVSQSADSRPALWRLWRAAAGLCGARWLRDLAIGSHPYQVAELTVQSTNTIRVGQIATELQAIRRAILRYPFDHDEQSFVDDETRLNKSADLLDQAIK